MDSLVNFNENGKPVTNSLLVAEKFGKRHSDVARSIRGIIQRAQNSAGSRAQNCVGGMYEEIKYVDEKDIMLITEQQIYEDKSSINS